MANTRKNKNRGRVRNVFPWGEYRITLVKFRELLLIGDLITAERQEGRVRVETRKEEKLHEADVLWARSGKLLLFATAISARTSLHHHLAGRNRSLHRHSYCRGFQRNAGMHRRAAPAPPAAVKRNSSDYSLFL